MDEATATSKEKFPFLPYSSSVSCAKAVNAQLDRKCAQGVTEASYVIMTDERNNACVVRRRHVSYGAKRTSTQASGAMNGPPALRQI